MKRLYKKAVACLLTAAMALSMATVCGAASSGTVADENTAALALPTPDEVVLSSEVVPISQESSKIAACKNALSEATELCMVAQMRVYSADKQLTTSEDLTMAKKGDGIYEKVSYHGATNMDLELTMPSQLEGYIVFPGDKMLWNVGSEFAVIMNLMYNNVLKIAQAPVEVYATTAKVGNTEYYAEQYTTGLLLKTTSTYCFAPDGQLQYVFSEGGSGQLTVIAYQTLQFGEGASGNLCQRPEGYTAYFYNDETLTGEDGSIYHVVGEEGAKKVVDQAGQDISGRFSEFLAYLQN